VVKLNASVAAFAGGCEQFDDYTVLALFRQTGGEQKYTFAPALSELERLRQILFQAANETFDKKKVYLACEEAFVNIVSYAKATQIEVRVKEVSGHLRVTFVDDGLAFNPLQEQPSKKSFEEFQSGGMGLTLIAKLSTPSYTPNPNTLTLTFTPKKA
jgi:sigma-B regulation protein RsbU (phosphoserine phosphatase)